MPNINLLPWREELRRRRQKEFAVLAVVAVVAMGIVIAGIHWEFNNRIEFQNKRNQYLLSQITLLDRKIKKIKDIEEEKQNLLARMEIIERLQTSRPEIVHVFDEIVRTLPEGVYYTEIRQTGRRFEVKGVAQSNARVSSLMRNIDASEWLEKPELIEIRKRKARQGQDEESRFSDFVLQFRMRSRSGEGEEEA